MLFNSNESIGKLLATLARHKGFSQTEIAERIGVHPVQLNRFFRGHNDIYSSDLRKIFAVFDIDLNKIVLQHILNNCDKTSTLKSRNLTDGVGYLLARLDRFGMQTYLSSLLWAAKVSRKNEKIPKRVEEIIQQYVSLI